MRLITIFAFFFILYGMTLQGRQILQTFDKSSFYKVMASGSLEDINSELKIVAAASIPEKEAYEGALLMKKAIIDYSKNSKILRPEDFQKRNI